MSFRGPLHVVPSAHVTLIVLAILVPAALFFLGTGWVFRGLVTWFAVDLVWDALRARAGNGRREAT